MSHSSATASAAMSTSASGNLSGKKQTVINELEKVLMKGRSTPEGKQNDRTEKEKKQIINENLLAARQRWLTQNRIKTESIAALAAASSSAGGSEESEDDEPPMMVKQRGLTYSCEPAVNTRIEKMDTIEVRANRAYSNTTFPQRIIPKPPNNPPPPLNVQVGTSPAGSASVSPNVRTQAAHKTPKETRKESSSSSATTSKMKKIFNFKPKKKKKRRTKKMTSIPPTRTGSFKGARSSKGAGRLPAQKSMSDSSLAKLNVLVSTSSIEEDGLIPINVPSLGYQNVFDNPEFAKYTQKSPNRSNTSSPMEVSLSAKPPKPLPRSVANGGSLGRTNMISTGSERDTDQETPPPYHTKIPIISPLLSSSPNSECLTPAFPLPLDDDGITTDSIPPIEIHAEDSTNTISRPRINTKERLTKTVSCNPDSSGGWDIKRRGSSQKQKELRRGVCSEGPAEDDDEDNEYITIPAALGVGTFQNSELHRANQDFLSVRGKVNSKDFKRLSAEYLKLIPLETDSNPSSPSSNRQTTKRRPPPPRPLQKVKTVPAFSDHPQLRCRKTSQGIDTNYNSADSPTDRQATRSASPSQSTDQIQSQKYHMESSISTQRNLQYISVSVNTSEKKRKPSVPKKYKYQVVNIDENGDPRMMQSTDAGSQSTEQQESSAARPELFSRGQQPTTNLASTGENTSSGNSNMEHRYYVNRNSVQIPQNSDNLPTTMLRTMDPLTGKIIWHEYVEIDEEEIDQIASRMGVSPSNITSTTQETPEKLEVLLSNVESNDGLNDSSEALPSASNTAGSSSTTPERVIDDSHLSGTSTASSECKYVLNINDPPTVPPRPEILDDLCDEEECRSSGDYSYAFIPGVGARWIMPGGHISPKMIITPQKETCAVSESSLNFKHQVPESSPVQFRASNSSKDSSQNLTINRPPSLPPKTDSLMREQQSLTNNGKVFPFLPDIIVQTRKSNIHSFQPKRAPPKVIPYKDHQKQKKFPANHPARLHTSSPNEASAANIAASEGLETKKQHSGQKTHKKLARQRSHGRRSYRKAATKTKDATRKPHLEVELVTKKTSKAESVASKLMETLSINDAAVKTTQETEHENSTKTQGLSKILNDLGQLLKSSNYSESDILSAIESHLKQGVNNEPKESLPQSIAVENSERDSTKYSDDEYGEPESWLSGEEPESEAELETSIPITFSPFSVTPSKPMDEDDSEAELDLKNIYESKRLIQSRESNDDLEYEEMASLPIFDSSISIDSKTHSYVNLQYGTEPKIYEHDESKRYSYVDMDIESNLDHLIQASPTRKMDNSRFQSSDDTDPKPTTSELGSASVSLRERSKSSSARNTQSVINPRSSRTQSNPDSELADAVLAGMVQGRTDNAQPMPRKNKSLPELRKHKILREETSLQMADTSKSERTLSYRLALQMEDILLSQSAEVNTSRRRLSAVREEGSKCKDSDFADADDFCCKSLQRSNAVITKRKQKVVVNSNTGSGVFSHKGGNLTKIGSDVTIEVPEGAVPRGQTQKICFNVIQRVYDPSADDDALCLSLSDSISTSQVESHLQEKRGKQVQLSPMIVVGPHDAVLEKPLVIRMPHCLPYRNNSWHLQMLGRPSIEGKSEDWQDIMNTIGLVQLSPTKSKSKFQNRSSYQMHLDYVQIKTSQLGSFKLVGRPIRNGTYAGKKMVSSVYAKAVPESKCVQIDIFVNNAIEDQSQALDNALTRHAHIPLMRDMPILCFGDGKDMEVTLSNDSNTAIPLGTKSVAFGQFWRSNKVGSSHIMFKVEDELVLDDRALTLKIQQAGSKLYHETNFLLPDVI